MITQNLNTGHSFGHCAFPHLVLQPFGCSFSIMSTVKEVWKKIDGYHNYEVSNMGRVRSLANANNKKVLKKAKKKNGEQIVCIYSCETSRIFLVKNLVEAAFLNSIDDGYTYLIHADGDKKNNKASNLIRKTRIESILHLSAVLNLSVSLVSRRFNVLEHEVSEILDLYVNKRLNSNEIAEKYILSGSAVRGIIRRSSGNVDAQSNSSPNGEIWKDIKGFPGYRVSNFGNVMSFERNKISGRKLVQSLVGKGYPAVMLYKGQKAMPKRVHRLVAKAFIPNPENKRQVNHIDGNKTNNHVSNLEWNTQSENMRHAVRTGLKVAPKGSDVYNSKLNDDKVLSIRKMYSTQKISQRDLAKKFNVSQRAIWNVIHQRTWSHV